MLPLNTLFGHALGISSYTFNPSNSVSKHSKLALALLGPVALFWDLLLGRGGLCFSLALLRRCGCPLHRLAVAATALVGAAGGSLLLRGGRCRRLV